MSPFPRHEGVWIDRQVEVDIFPARIEARGVKILGGLAMFFGLSFGGLPIVALVMAVVQEGWSRDLLTALLLSVPLVVLFGWMTIYGVDQWIQRTIIELDGDTVSWEWRTWRGTRRHREPITNFDGLRSDRYFDSDDGQMWEVLLQHPDPKYTVLLYRANRRLGLEERWQRYCQVFGLPPLESLGLGGSVVRPVRDLDRPLATLVREGRVTIPDPGAPPPGVEVVCEADRTVLRLPRQPDIVIGPDQIAQVRGGFFNHGVSVTFDDVVTLNVEPERGTLRGHVLILRYRRTLAKGPGLELSETLAKKLPVATLVWAQTFILRVLPPATRCPASPARIRACPVRSTD